MYNTCMYKCMYSSSIVDESMIYWIRNWRPRRTKKMRQGLPTEFSKCQRDLYGNARNDVVDRGHPGREVHWGSFTFSSAHNFIARGSLEKVCSCAGYMLRVFSSHSCIQLLCYIAFCIDARLFLLQLYAY